MADDDQAFRSLLESGWKNVGRKGSRAKLASTISKAFEEPEIVKPTPSEPSASTDVKASASSSSTSMMGSSQHKLGSWGRLLSKASIAEPETVAPSDEVATSAMHVEAVEGVDESRPAQTAPENDEEVTEAVLEDAEPDAVEVGEADVVEEAYIEEEEGEFPEFAGEEAADLDEFATEEMVVDDVGEAQEVTEDDMQVEDTADVEENVADEMEEEEAAALAALEGKVSAVQEAEPPKAAPKPAIAKVSTAKPAAPKPAAAKAASTSEKPADDDDDDCIIVDDDDGNTAGAEFRQALDDLPSGKVMQAKAKAQIRPKASAGPVPKPPAGAPPKAPGVTPVKTPADSNKNGQGGGKPVRTPSGNLGQPPKCKNGCPLKLNRNSGGYSCDECGSSHTTHRCAANCDYDLCNKCYFDKVNRAAPGLRHATPIVVGKAGGPKANPPKAGINRTIVPNQQGKAGSITPLSRTNSGNSGQASSPKLETKISGGKIIRTNSGNSQTPLVRMASGNAGKGGTIQPAITPGNSQAPLVRMNSGNAGKGGKIQPAITPNGGEMKRVNSGSIVPLGSDLKRTNSGGIISPQGAQGARNKQPENVAKRARTDTGPIAATDAEGRKYNLTSVVVNFANVGASYAKKVLKRDGDKEPQMLFDWEGVRRCVNYLGKNLGLKVVGVIYENFWATDNNSKNKVELPADIRRACESVEETPRIVGRNHGSADDEMTIKCAYHRNCRFMDNDNYRDWKQQLRDEKCRSWLDKCQDLLHMRYYFDSSMGVFETLDGNVPPGLLAPDGQKIPVAVSKRDLWTAPNR